MVPKTEFVIPHKFNGPIGGLDVSLRSLLPPFIKERDFKILSHVKDVISGIVNPCILAC